ncbi:hypothetical protein Bbelb_325950 [Branchiostoma belcheri]|nr:hypothetical protein Bbelb_325950 [Branchiostoma belcheri]
MAWCEYLGPSEDAPRLSGVIAGKAQNVPPRFSIYAHKTNLLSLRYLGLSLGEVPPLSPAPHNKLFRQGWIRRAWANCTAVIPHPYAAKLHTFRGNFGKSPDIGPRTLCSAGSMGANIVGKSGSYRPSLGNMRLWMATGFLLLALLDVALAPRQEVAPAQPCQPFRLSRAGNTAVRHVVRPGQRRQEDALFIAGRAEFLSSTGQTDFLGIQTFMFHTEHKYFITVVTRTEVKGRSGSQWNVPDLKRWTFIQMGTYVEDSRFSLDSGVSVVFDSLFLLRLPWVRVTVYV